MSVCVLLGGISLEAQQSGTLIGTVTDQVGKALPGASVEVRNESTGANRSALTDDNGKFAFQELPAGTYTIAASSPVSP